ncbi:hypothetical protein SAMN04489724_3038 [Algoriphagus locisalis]|uniref:Uncharacterized protein n=1 Tax=Algoriphagus locisalis TaxID=305507 RepID=A0A1I7CBI9_9BACT|nr:hypothetical protein [Algoriphagus locisalis]SFT96773.1 hypothetical protein SAMN04489724_3038 [Algoriphagus locisalis]
MNNRLEILKKKAIGKSKFNAYQNHFRDFSSSKHIDLESSENLLQSLNFSHSSEEIIDSENNFIESELLRKLYKQVDEGSISYAFTDDFEYCGVYLVKTKEAIEKSFRIAREDYNHTFFFLEAASKFFVRINFYDRSHLDFPASFDIQISENY